MHQQPKVKEENNTNTKQRTEVEEAEKVENELDEHVAGTTTNTHISQIIAYLFA